MSDVTEIREKPGYIRLKRTFVINNRNERVDISSLVVEIKLFEDLFAPFMTGSIMLMDAVALAELLPFQGTELIAFELEGPNYPEDKRATRTGLFHIYKMANLENLTTKGRVYTLYFQSIEATVDLNRAISRTFRGKISDTVQKLAEDPEFLRATKPIIVEPTSNTEVHTSNFWSPVKNIYYLAERALNKHNNPSYTFFENNEGFVFASLDTLAAAEPAMTFYKDQNNATDTFNGYRSVLDMNNPVVFDYIDRARTGYYGGKVYFYELESKKMNTKILVPQKEIKKTFLNEGNLLDQGTEPFNQESAISTNIVHNAIHSISPKATVDIELRRKYLLSSINNQRVNIQVFGRLEYSVGQVITLVAYTNTSIDSETTQERLVDKVVSGKYLITALSHEITPSSHLCNIELCKDSVIL